MRVCYVLFRYPQLSQTFVRDEIWALRRAGAEVSVISLDDPGEERPLTEWSGPYEVARRPGVAETARDLAWWMRHAPRRLAAYLWSAAREPHQRRYMLRRGPSLARGLAEWRPEHVRTHFAYDAATVAAGLSTLLGASCSITVHANDIYTEPRAAVRRRLGGFDRVLTVCQYNVGYLEGTAMMPAGRSAVRVIPCGVDVVDDAERQPSIDVVGVGRLIEKKGFAVLLRALATLRAERAATITIVGDGPERGALMRLARELGLGARVSFVGAQPHAAALDTIARGRVFCLPALRADDGDVDAMPVVIREAMARGVPVVASRLTGIPESVDEEVGWLVEPGSVTDLARALDVALADRGELERRGARGRQRARERWRFSTQAAALSSLIEELSA